MPTELFIVLQIFIYFSVINAYSEQIISTELSNSSDGWTLTGAYTFPSTNALCVNSATCLELGNSNGYADKSFDLTGYFYNYFRFDVVSNGPSGSFSYSVTHNSGFVSGLSGSYGSTPSVFVRDDRCLGCGNWDNSDVRIKLRMSGSDATHKIYISNFIFYGTPYPTVSPTEQPTIPTISPIMSTGSSNPTSVPTNMPTSNPTFSPSRNPTNNPTLTPVIEPTNSPLINPTLSPTNIPTSTPSGNPTTTPSYSPTKNPTVTPTFNPTNIPTITTNTPTKHPTKTPIYTPTNNPTINTYMPTESPSTSTTPISHQITHTETDPTEQLKQNDKNVQGDEAKSMDSKELIIWILIAVAAFISMGTIIGCCIVIRLFYRSKKASSSNAFGENNQDISAMTMDSDLNGTQHIENNLSAEIEMGTASAYMNGASHKMNTNQKFVNAFSESRSRSNSDMYVHNDNVEDIITPTNGDDDITTSPGLT